MLGPGFIAEAEVSAQSVLSFSQSVIKVVHKDVLGEFSAGDS
jgi:hypothetical protein